MKPLSWQNQRGAGLIIIVAMLLILGVIGAVFVSLIGNESFTAMNQSAGLLTFGITDGGVEFEQYNLAQNVDWYRSATDPMTASIRTIGTAPNTGSFTVSSNLPATKLSKKFETADATATVYTTQRFPSACPSMPGAVCYLQMEDDIAGTAEFVSYTIGSGTTFTIIAHGVSVGVVNSAASRHDRNDRVYPVTNLLTLQSNASCAVTTPFQITANSKFLSAGTISIYDNSGPPPQQEEIDYTGSSTSGNTMTLTGVRRCRNGTGPFTLNVGSPVTPLTFDNASPDYQAEIVSTGTVAVTITGNAIRVIRKTVQR
jgi:hypothetical protein